MCPVTFFHHYIINGMVSLLFASRPHAALCSIFVTNSSLIRKKGESQNARNKKTKRAKFSEKRIFLNPQYAYVRSQIRSKKFSFFGKFAVLCFLVTSVLRFAFLPYYQQIGFLIVVFHHLHMIVSTWETYQLLRIFRVTIQGTQ